MRKTVLFTLLFVPLLAFAGWDYYTLNEDGEWEQVSRFDLDLEAPDPDGASAARADKPRVLILYTTVKKKPKRREARNWIRQVDPELVEVVE